MKFHPILFSTEMVQAILEGRKTQTRRVVKIGGTLPNCEKQPLSTHNCCSVYKFWGTDEVQCPFGAPGDVLWVRETFRKMDSNSNPFDFRFKTDYDCSKDGAVRWKPSIFMPKEACRIFLKINSVKVERLGDISESDAISEGIERVNGGWRDYYYKDVGNCGLATVSYFTLWQSINKDFDPIDDNPWVWVIEFERIEKPQNFE